MKKNVKISLKIWRAKARSDGHISIISTLPPHQQVHSHLQQAHTLKSSHILFTRIIYVSLFSQKILRKYKSGQLIISTSVSMWLISTICNMIIIPPISDPDTRLLANRLVVQLVKFATAINLLIVYVCR